MNVIYHPAADLIPETDGTYDIGSDAARFVDGFFSNDVDVEGDIIVDGNVDGRDVSADGVVLDLLFHVGYVMLSTVSTNPATIGYPGTWTQISQGRCLIGEGTGVGLTARTNGAEVGQEDAITVSHTHSIDHNHASTTSGTGSANHTHSMLSHTHGVSGTTDSHSVNHNHEMKGSSSTGGSNTFRTGATETTAFNTALDRDWETP